MNCVVLQANLFIECVVCMIQAYEVKAVILQHLIELE